MNFNVIKGQGHIGFCAFFCVILRLLADSTYIFEQGLSISLYSCS